MTKAELVKLIKENFYNEEEDVIDIRELKFDCSVAMDGMEVKGSLYQSSHKVTGNLHQSFHKVDGNLFQHSHKAEGKIMEGNHKKRLKKITHEELAILGYRLEDSK